MNLLSDVITYVRRLIKSTTNAEISDDLLIDYINRFWLMDVDARIQLFDLKTVYQFQTQPGVDRYNMPLYDVQVQPGSQVIASFPVYQGFTGNAKCNGIEIPFYTQRTDFFRLYPNVVQQLSTVAVGDGGSTYNIQIPILANSVPLNPPVQTILRGHVDITGIMATGVNQDPPLVTSFNTNIPVTSVSSAFWLTTSDSTGANLIVQDSGQFLSSNVNCGLLMTQGNAPLGNAALSGGYSVTSNVINYVTGECNVTFPQAVPQGVNINAQCYYFQTGLPRALLYYNNVITLRNVPSQQWLIEIDAYLTPAAFLSSDKAIPFGYMAEYIARGAARKLLSDTGDVEQFNFYEPLFREQEMLVLRRSQRQVTATRTPTIYSTGMGGGYYGGTGLGGYGL